jgi:endonuclease VIII
VPEGHTIHRIARDHGELLVGRTVGVGSPQGRFAADAARVDGAVLERLEAAGKHLFYHWSTGEVGHVHLGLFGRFRVHRDIPAPMPRGAVRMRLETAEVAIDLSGPTACTVDPPDVRRDILARLGPDPLRRGARPEPMIERMRRSQRAVGDLLMDQSVVAGVGNVYRAEALFVVGMHPERPGADCAEPELRELWSTVRTMLRRGVRDDRIVTVRRDELGLPRGRRVPRAEATYVYKRSRCIRCGDAIRTVEIGGRTCYFCPTDQPS